MKLKLFGNRIITSYDIEQFKRKLVNILFFLFGLLVILIIITLALRPPPGLPPSGGSFIVMNLSILGEIEAPQDVEMLPSPKGGHYLQDLRIVIEMPEVPLCIEKRGSDIPLSEENGFAIAIKNVSVTRVPETLNVRAYLKRHGEFCREGIPVSSVSGDIKIPRIIFR
jgi:hypothetical protein